MTTGHIAAADCERCRHGAIAQPVNTVSSLAFCIAGLIVISRARRPRVDAEDDGRFTEEALGWSAVAAGLGSVAYHGPGTRAGQILHDASLITMAGALVVADTTRITGRRTSRAVLAALPVVATAAASSPWSLPVQAATGGAAATAEVIRVRRAGPGGRHRPRAIVAALLAGLGAIGHVLGRTGGPLCRPDSPWQAHAAWHTAMAAVLVLRDRAVPARFTDHHGRNPATVPRTDDTEEPSWPNPPTNPDAK